MRIYRHRRRVEWMVQAALGALIGELILGRQLGNRALVWGALVGISPSAEWLVMPVLNTAGALMWVGGISHSALVLGIFGYGLVLALTWCWRLQKIEKSTVVAFVAAILAGHLVLDCLTLEGTAILWPFISQRVAVGVLDGNDFVLAMGWLVVIGWIAWTREVTPKKSRIKKPLPMTKRRKLCLWGLALGLVYLITAVGMKSISNAKFDADLVRGGVKFDRKLIGPMPYNFLLWRAVVDLGDELWVGYRSVFDSGDRPVRWTAYAKGQQPVLEMANSSEIRAINEFTDAWWIARPNAKGAWLGDLRSPESRTWEVRKTMVDSRLDRSWVLDKTSDSEQLREVVAPPRYDKDFIKRMGSRIFGNHERWEGNPRLSGVVGSLPESLSVYEN